MNIKLIVGLGNPTAEYEYTRHNAGFWFLDELAYQWRAPFKNEKKFHGDIARVAQPQGDVWLLKPDTYMNLSGKAVAALTQFYKIQPEEILVVHDELDIPCGHIRSKLGTPNFYRLRLGIGHPGDRSLVVGFVLSNPPASERQLIDNAIAKSLQAMPDIMAGDLEKTVRHLHSK